MRKNALIIALAILTVIDTVLVTAAFLHGDGRSPPAEGAAVEYTPEAVASSPAQAAPARVRKLPSMEAAIAAAAPQRRFIAYGADGAVLRATEGECPALTPANNSRNAKVELSIDGGRSFVGSAPKVTQVLRLAVTSSDNLWFVGTDAKCAPWLYRTLDAGATWSRESPTDTWYLDINSRSDLVHAPRRSVRVGCIPVALSVLADSAYVGCANGDIRSTTDEGLTWQTKANLPGVVGVTFGDSERGYVLRSITGCDAAVFSTVDGGATWLGSACLPGEKPQAIDVTGDVVMAIVDDKLQTSSDRGGTWTTAL